MSFVNKAIMICPKNNMNKVVKIVTIPDILTVDMRPVLILLILFAPIFWPTNVERACEKDIAGTVARVSSRLATEYAAITLVPKVFTIPISASPPMATRVCWIPVGKPILIL